MRLIFIFGYLDVLQEKKEKAVLWGNKIREGWVGLEETQLGSTFSCSRSKLDEMPRVLSLLG